MSNADYELGRQEGYGAGYSGEPNPIARSSSWFSSLEDWDDYLTGWYEALGEAQQQLYAEWQEGNSE